MRSRERYSEYDGFAWIYSRDWGAEYHSRARPALERLIYDRLIPGSRVLDLCCGSGDLSVELANHGYEVTGVDGSEAMLAYARRKVPSGVFLPRDARDFDFPPQFHAAFSTFDSLNHIIELPALASVFQNVYRSLRPGGFFLFDLNMEEAFTTLWRGSSATVDETEVCITKGTYDRDAKLGRAQVTMFRMNKRWERSDVVVLERCYSEEEVFSALQQSGFPQVCAYDAYEVGMTGDVALGRKFFLATKQ